MEGTMESDATPFDTDFSEITTSNLNNNGLKEILNSTYSSMSYGSTYYVIKKGDFDEAKSYSGGDERKKARYLRTAIGSNKISYIITPDWSEENAYIMAQNGIYIPVVDLDSEKIIFTYEQYEAIREKMKGLTFYRADEFEIDVNARNEKILDEAKKMREHAIGTISTEKKREKIVELVESNLPKKVVQDMCGDLSSEIVEFIDTGSTGRGTNIPGDGDFDFMLKCFNREEQSKNIELMEKFLEGEDKGGTNEFNIRYKNVKVPGLDSPVDIDVTSETKKLELEYSSDLCVRDRLDNIRKNYGEEACKEVVDNIIVAKKKLKEIGAYKKFGSDGHTKLGGFGGIGVENWILQNGGSFILAMETFLDNAIDEEGNKVDFEEFKEKYPIYDFGQNHRADAKNDGHDHFIEGLTEEGFKKLTEQFRQILKEYEIEYMPNAHLVEPIKSNKQKEEQNKARLYESIKEKTIDPEYIISDISRIYVYIARYKGNTVQIHNVPQGR